MNCYSPLDSAALYTLALPALRGAGPHVIRVDTIIILRKVQSLLCAVHDERSNPVIVVS